MCTCSGDARPPHTTASPFASSDHCQSDARAYIPASPADVCCRQSRAGANVRQFAYARAADRSVRRDDHAVLDSQPLTGQREDTRARLPQAGLVPQWIAIVSNMVRR
jgi:hypothetical protein